MGMTEKSTDMIVELSFPNVPIGNPEHSEGMDPHFHGDDKRGTWGRRMTKKEKRWQKQMDSLFQWDDKESQVGDDKYREAKNILIFY